ncbi:YcaO-like family protein [Inquilinus sp. Marseille-Q2685]|uniref:YcaO-like family protein n=1 Tax=Inquilinus sp. Marseille-Q2685 TaxID=2866581 RepID=UPI001CE3C060|nr:YcaO-like family protein [Inquilinus sp. Marseille-Q2685]
MLATPSVYDACALLFERASGAADSDAAGRAAEEARRLLAAFGVTPDGSDEDGRTARLFRLAATLEASFAVPATDYPGLTVLGARLRRPAGGGAAIAADGVIGCDPSPWRAFQKCIGEAAETMALAAPGIGDAARDGGIETIGPRFAGQVEARTGMDSAAALDAAPVVGGTELATGRPVLVPRPLVFGPSDGLRAAVPVSEGCAAGPTLEDATRSAVFELVERHVVAHWWHGGRPARRLPQALMAAAIGRLRPGVGTPWPRQGFALELDADGLPLAVVAAASVSPVHGLVALGFAARPGRAAALEAAVLEMVQSEIANDLLFLRLRRAGPAPAPADQARLAAKRRLRPETLLATAQDDAAEGSTGAPDSLPGLLAGIVRRGIAIFRVDLTGRAGIPVVKLLSPDLQPSSAAAMTEGLRQTASQFGRPLNDLIERPAIFNSL